MLLVGAGASRVEASPGSDLRAKKRYRLLWLRVVVVARIGYVYSIIIVACLAGAVYGLILS